MPCNCGSKSKRNQSQAATALQQQLEAARQEALKKKTITVAAPPAGQKQAAK